MKPFVVVKFKTDPHGFHFRPVTDRNNRVAYSQAQAEAPVYGDIAMETDLYYVDNRADADALAEVLSARFSHYTWLVCETKVVLYREPGKLNKAQYTDKGLMPV